MRFFRCMNLEIEGMGIVLAYNGFPGSIYILERGTIRGSSTKWKKTIESVIRQR
jgi:hypothetical protein